MSVIYLKPGVDPLQVKTDLQAAGITMGQKLPDGGYVAFIPRWKWLILQFPELETLIKQDRAFWRQIRKRLRNGEKAEELRDEIRQHAQYYQQQFNEIISKYES